MREASRDATTSDSPTAATPRWWSPIVVGGAIAGAWLVAIWWTVRPSLELVLISPNEQRVCPAIYPAPPECSPEWHVSIAGTSAGAVLLAYAAVVVLSSRVQRWRRPAMVLALAALTAAGLIGFVVTDDPNRYLLRPF